MVTVERLNDSVLNHDITRAFFEGRIYTGTEHRERRSNDVWLGNGRILE